MLATHYMCFNMACAEACKCDHKSFPSTGFDLRVSQLENVIYFSIIVIPEKSHCTIFVIHTSCKTWKSTCEFHLYCWDHVFKVNEWCFVDCFHHKFRIFYQMMVHNYFLAKCKQFSAYHRLLMVWREVPCVYLCFIQSFVSEK